MTEVLSVREIVKTFGAVRAVDGVSFSVRQGTITGLLGRNGAGKTTTIRMITGIFMPDSGSIEWSNGGGNQQKIQLIGALLHDPDLIVLDEPQSGLDPVNMVLVRNLLRELKEEGKTILLSTHMMGEAERMADEIVLVHQGKVVLSGRLDFIRSSFSKNTLHIEFDGDGSFLADLPQVKRSMIVNNAAELSLAEGADPQKILEASIGRLRIRRFELATPSLEQIFIEKVGAESLEAVL